MAEGVSERELARRMGVNPAIVNRWVKRGVVQVIDGLVDPDAAMDAIAASGSVAYAHMAEARRKTPLPSTPTPRKPAVAAEPERPGNVAQPESAGSAASVREMFNEARARREKFAAELAGLELQRRSGELVEIATAEKVLFEQGRAARDAWLNWPARVGPLIAATLGLADVDAVVRLLTDHVHKQVESLGIASTDFVAEQRPH